MTENPIKDSGIEDDPIIPDPDEFETQDEEQEFDYLDGVEVPDPDNADEEEADEDDFPDDEDGEN